MPKCGCNVGPGRFEGEGPLTAYVHYLEGIGAGGEYFAAGDGSWVGFFAMAPGDFGPFTAEERKEMLDEGYCDPCVDDAQEELQTLGAITYGSDSQGFLWSKTWSREDTSKAQEAFDLDAQEAAEAEEAAEMGEES